MTHFGRSGWERKDVSATSSARGVEGVAVVLLE